MLFLATSCLKCGLVHLLEESVVVLVSDLRSRNLTYSDIKDSLFLLVCLVLSKDFFVLRYDSFI